jgi:hypothetical protein
MYKVHVIEVPAKRGRNVKLMVFIRWKSWGWGERIKNDELKPGN